MAKTSLVLIILLALSLAYIGADLYWHHANSQELIQNQIELGLAAKDTEVAAAADVSADSQRVLVDHQTQEALNLAVKETQRLEAERAKLEARLAELENTQPLPPPTTLADCVGQLAKLEDIRGREIADFKALVQVEQDLHSQTKVKLSATELRLAAADNQVAVKNNLILRLTSERDLAYQRISLLEGKRPFWKKLVPHPQITLGVNQRGEFGPVLGLGWSF